MNDASVAHWFWTEFAVLAGFWLLIAFACAVIASNKGRSGVLWFIIGALTAVIGLVVIAALPSERSTQKPRGNSKRCPFCAEEILSAAVVCKHCGRDIPAIEQVPSGPEDDRLIVAVKEGSWGTAFSLLNGGANPNTRDHTGRTALEIAKERGDHQIASLLISKGAS